MAEILQKRLSEAGRQIETAKDPEEINSIVEEVITELTEAEFASLWIFDEQRGVLYRKRNDDSLNEISILEQKGIIARSFLTMSGGIYNYLASEKEYDAQFDNPDRIRIKSKIITPLVDGDRFLGLATAYSSVRRIRNFTKEDLKLLEALAPFLVEAVYKIRPDLRSKRSEDMASSETINQKATAVGKKVEAIQEPSEMQAREPDEILGFLANTVHDIRTPANSLAGFLELLEERIDDGRILQFIRNARESAEFINELTTSILDRVSMRQANGHRIISINPIKFFSDIAAGFSAGMYDKKLTFNVFLDPSLPSEIRTDAFRLKRVVMNLLGNALKFTPTGKGITFSVEYDSQGKRMAISVADQGIGIAKENQKKIFEAFAQADAETALRYGGTGLGLSISAQYVAELGGSLRLESELEKGSRFFFEIPVEIVEENPRFPTLKSPPKHLAILLDETHGAIAMNIEKYLERLGVERQKVRRVSNLQQLSKNTTHLIAFSSVADPEDLKKLRDRGMEILVVEEDLFSLANRRDYEEFTVISPFAAYLPDLYDFLVQSEQGKPVPRKVLVVDDNRINIELLRVFLEDELFQVEVASDGKEGLRMLEEALNHAEPFALAFVDRHLPGISGTELIKRYRDIEPSGQTKLYAVSITGDPKEDSRDHDLFDATMRKPFKKQEVKDILSNLRLPR